MKAPFNYVTDSGFTLAVVGDGDGNVDAGVDSRNVRPGSHC